MIKRRQLPVVTITAADLDATDASLKKQGFTKWKMTSDDNGVVFSGTSFDGSTTRFASYSKSVFQERHISRTNGRVSPEDRKKEAKRLRKTGMTQAQIAERLGCAQKTISNDLRN